MQVNEAKHHLKNHGWTQREAADVLRVDLSYLNRVINGKLKSKRLIAAIMRLQPSPTAMRKPVYANMQPA
jgi:predicted XRE-type DNA-binding protein